MRKNHFLKFLAVILTGCCTSFLSATEYYVATTGDDANPGTIDQPFKTPNKAVDVVQPGDYIYMRGGTYMLDASIKLKAKHSGRPDARIYMWGYPGERVILDGSQIPASNVQEFKMARCIYVNHEANYWHFKNLEMCHAKDNGMKIEGSYNIVENCKFYENNDTGLQLGMYKEFTYEDTKSLPAGEPQFNPGYQFCRNNVIINCDSWYNYDSKSFTGSDDGGDADGFAAKLFPGPGTEFIGCRAWMNSDDNWDLYMVYHPIVIDNCWSWKAGYLPDGKAGVNGNGFKLGGGGTSGGAAFAQSVGAHVVKNSIAFDCLHKGFDQNNAYEGMYLFNNLSFNNEYNYRFPTEFKYGGMYMRNNIGFKATKENHEFLSEGKTGAQVPNTAYNSWTKLDGCSPYKESTKVSVNGKNVNVYTKDYTSEFISLSSTLFMAERQADGSLPDNDFGKIKAENSVFIDAGEIINDFEPKTFLTSNLPVDYVNAANITIPYNGVSADMGAYEYGDPTQATLKLNSGNTTQTVYTGTDISEIVYKWGGAATDVSVEGLPAGTDIKKDVSAKTVTIFGKPTATGTYTVKTIGGVNEVELSGTITISLIAPGTLVCTSNNLSQIINIGTAVEDIVIEWGGGAEDVTVTGLPAGLESSKSGNTLTISGTPAADGSFTVTTVGGMNPLTLSGKIERVIPTKTLLDWYNFQDSELPADVAKYVSFAGTSTTILKPTATDVFGSCSAGYLNLDQQGYLLLTLPSLAELKIRWCTSGTARPVEFSYGTPGTDESTWTKASSSESVAKNAQIDWDIMAKASIPQSKAPICVKIKNNRTDAGGMRLTDLYIKVYDETGITGIENTLNEKVSFDFYQTETALIVYGEIASLKVYNLSGQQVIQSVLSQVVNTGGLPQGIYIVNVTAKDGRRASFKFVK